VWTPAKVANAPDPVAAWCEYTQQVIGVPWPTIQDLTTVRKHINELFDHYPQADFYTLCRLTQWCKARKRRFTRMPFVVLEFREAWARGGLPELDPRTEDERLELRIRAALAIEQRDSWRHRLLTTVGNDLRRATLAEWETGV
jgi:hypothetical protein